MTPWAPASAGRRIEGSYRDAETTDPSIRNLSQLVGGVQADEELSALKSAIENDLLRKEFAEDDYPQWDIRPTPGSCACRA